MNRLDEIVTHKQGELAGQMQAVPLARVRAAAESAPPAPDFLAALRRSPGQPLRLVAEIKRASPSRGVLAADLDPLDMARRYRQAGAAAVSVLTDRRFFLGSLETLEAVAQSQPGLPLLRKDFLLDEYQVYEARAAGAAAVLLIVACLEPARLSALRRLAEALGLAALVEVHDRTELDTALACGASLIGVNNRNLKTFAVSLDSGLDLLPRIPSGVVSVAESGVHTRADAQRLAQAGAHAVLVGEALVTAPDPALKIQELVG